MSPESIIYLGLASVLIGLLSAWLFALAACPGMRRIAAVRRPLCSDFWFGVGVAPLIVGISFFFFSFGSGWLSFAGWLADHCPLHPGHPHLCLRHIASAPPGGFVFYLALASGGLWILCQTGRVFFPGLALSAKFSVISRPNEEYRVLPSRIAAAFTAGLIWPRVYLTTQADQLLQPDERAIVLIHEKAHARRRDPMRSMILTLSERCFPGVKAIRRRWLLAAEAECDRAAVRAGFSETRVARTILKVKRVNQDAPPQTSLLHYASSDAEALRTRLQLLLSDSPSDGRLSHLWTLLLMFWFFSLLALPDVHHAMETLLGWLS